MAYTPPKSARQSFGGTGAEVIRFLRSVNTIFITVDSSATLSFDGGTTFMTMTAGTYTIPVGSLKELHIGAGTWSGFGLAV